MPRITDFQVTLKPEHPALFIRSTTSVQSLPQIIGEGFTKVGRYIESLGEIPTDIPYLKYLQFEEITENNINVEIYFDTPRLLPDKEDIKSIMIPEIKLVSCMYRGDYNDMAPVYNEMIEWIKNNGYELVGDSFEYYYNGENFPIEEMLTKVVMPIK